MHEFVAELAAVDPLERLDNVSKLHGAVLLDRYAHDPVEFPCICLVAEVSKGAAFWKSAG